MRYLKRLTVACHIFFIESIRLYKPVVKHKCLLIWSLAVSKKDMLIHDPKFVLGLIFLRWLIDFLVLLITSYSESSLVFGFAGVVLSDNHPSSDSNRPLDHTLFSENISYHDNQIDESSSDTEQSNTAIELEKKIEETRYKVRELGNISDNIKASINEFREKILIAREPTVIRTSAYSSHNPDNYGTDPTSYYDGMDPCCTKNAPYNAINHLNSMEGNIKWIVKINETYPNISLYIYDQNECPTNIGFKDISFNMRDKIIVIYNGKTDMELKDMELLRNCICTFMYSEHKVEMNLCVGQNQYNKMPEYLRPNSTHYPHPISIRDYDNLPNTSISKVNTFYSQFNKRPIRRFY